MDREHNQRLLGYSSDPMSHRRDEVLGDIKENQIHPESLLK